MVMVSAVAYILAAVVALLMVSRVHYFAHKMSAKFRYMFFQFQHDCAPITTAGSSIVFAKM